MNKELTPLEALEFLGDLEAFTGECEEERTSMINELPEYKIIETALKNYEKLTSKPIIWCGRTHGQTQAIIDYICKNYKEVKITNLEDDKKLKALEIIKETPMFAWYVTIYKDAYEMISDAKGFRVNNSVEELQQMFDLLKEVLL